jgi:hypothetical protein
MSALSALEGSVTSLAIYLCFEFCSRSGDIHFHIIQAIASQRGIELTAARCGVKSRHQLSVQRKHKLTKLPFRNGKMSMVDIICLK